VVNFSGITVVNYWVDEHNVSELTPGSRWWGAFYVASQSLEVAAEQAVRGSEAGYQVYVLNTLDYASLGKAGEEWWAVCAGMYATKVEAETAAALLAADGFSGAYAKEVY